MPRAASGLVNATMVWHAGIPSRPAACHRAKMGTACQPVRSPRTQARQRQHRPASAAGQSERRRWQDLVSPHVNMGVPQLLMLLEPKLMLILLPNIITRKMFSVCCPYSRATVC